MVSSIIRSQQECSSPEYDALPFKKAVEKEDEVKRGTSPIYAQRSWSNRVSNKEQERGRKVRMGFRGAVVDFVNLPPFFKKGFFNHYRMVVEIARRDICMQEK
ncbi:hypothetical protein H206_03289 [Candidatus Electrothrix aarhusensis]|uniref:Uncharacterized protein n=1 Tax=Candidatus Electrothrix aarhusensis TaxID=1859131 RepID=A0A3S3RM55_9BACT|nr:hypothetical protein H206_03289 [Candidatus Electrothrix aarhusensis]